MNKPTLAVIGSGIAGLSAAWLLKDKFQVTLFERHKAPGMGAYSVNVGEENTPVHIDIPLRIITSGYYHELFKLYQTIGVEIERTDHAGAFFDASGEQVFHYKNYQFGQRSYSFVSGPNRFTRSNISHALEAVEFLKRIDRGFHWNLANQTFGDFLKQAGYKHSSFVRWVLMPMLSTICTCDYNSIYQYPAKIILDYLTCGVSKEGVWKAKYGVPDIVKRLTTGYQVKTEADIQAISMAGPTPTLTLANGEQFSFDQVVVATQPQHAAQMIQADLPETAQDLAAIPFEQSDMVVHRDQSIYPVHWRKLSPVCYSIDKQQQRPMATVCLNKSMPSVKDCQPVFQTWHPTIRINPDKILATATFERPLMNFESIRRIKNIQTTMTQNQNTLWFCGSYLGGGIPLLEAGVRSSLRVANALGVETPW
ncbi:FAD-dependent oxidoreductase [Litoribacillus peritrichatus]|uniref:NAD(P)-binding protein n=1 Tax=Litoribacillus peritrichatus TaxID=718191 RepID=A0ABP7NFB3_9GAMM